MAGAEDLGQQRLVQGVRICKGVEALEEADPIIRLGRILAKAEEEGMEDVREKGSEVVVIKVEEEADENVRHPSLKCLR
jgi:hypothetical protein